MSPRAARVLVLSNMYPPHHYGGYELSCRDVMDRFEAHGHDVTVLTTTMRVPGVDDPPDEHARGVWRELEFYWDDHVLQSPPLWRRAQIERHNQRALRHALDAVRPDVVSIWNMGAMSLGLVTTLTRTGLPLVFNVCDDWLVYGPLLDPWTRVFRRAGPLAALAAYATRLPTRFGDIGAAGTFCFVSERTRAYAERATGWSFPRSTVVYSGIDRVDFPPIDPPDAGARPWSWSWRLLYVGRIDDRKGIEVVLDALPLLPDETTVELLGKGDNEYLAHLRARTAELGLDGRVTFGAADRSELRHRYAAADVFVFPSTWAEPFGLVPVEAMACGTPVVGTGRGGSGEFMVDGANCLLVPAGEPEALAGAVERLARDAELRAALVRGGLRTAAELTVDALADCLEEWHLAAIDDFRAGEPAHRRLPAHVTGSAP